jgi:cyclic-di-AMP phosphodiesterase PgpH
MSNPLESLGAHKARPYRQRRRLRRIVAALLVAVIAIVVAATAAVIADDLFGGSNEDQLAAFVGGVAGFTAAIVAAALMPLVRKVSGRSEEAVLLEAANPAHPLLRQLMIDAPGTYAHSVAVANLAETAAMEIGANPLLARVGAYYHDVGKISSACWYYENQRNGDNPHDRISPSQSVAVITQHVREGERLGREYHLPAAVDDIIAQHHGTSLVRYFYYRAANEGARVFEGDYRYQGVKPQTREAALVMLADGCEAAVRAMMTEDPDVVASVVDGVFEERRADDQLSESGLTAEDLTVVAEVYSGMLTSMHHGRCEYPQALRRLPADGDQRHQSSTA